MIEILLDAKNTVFTCTFKKQVKDTDVAELLKNIKKKTDLVSTSLAKQILNGDKTTLTCFLTKSEPQLGRSLVIDLNFATGDRKGFRQIDHRTLEELIIKNVKYQLKK